VARTHTPWYGQVRDERGSDGVRSVGDDGATLRGTPIRRFPSLLVVAALVAAGLLTVPAGSARAATLPSLPGAWPSTRLELGLADAPGGAAALSASADFQFRYQYLAGGANTGDGWATWNTDGQFVSWYIQDSADHGMTPVFPYYMLLQSSPSSGADEKARDLSNLANPSTMASMYADLRLFFQRAAGSTKVVLHVEPDLWGYIEQASTGDDAATVPASVASSGDSALAGLPNTAAGFARAVVRLRDQLAPNVLLAYHLSVWGTMWDIAYSNSPDPQVDELAGRAADFYQSLGADFDLTFTDIADRDAAFKELVYGDGGASRWDDADFVRYARFIKGYVGGTGHRVVVWQIPLGNTKMRSLDNTWGHYQDNRAEWFLEDPSGTHLALWRDAGVIALLFGGGADGTTCACDAQGDGITNPAAINGNNRIATSADDDGGYFRERARAYYASGGLSLVAGTPAPPIANPPPNPPVAWSRSASAKPSSLTRKHSVTLTVRVRASRATKAMVDIRIYDPKGKRVFRRAYDARSFKAGVTRAFKPTFYVSSARRLGKYHVTIRVYTVGGKKLLSKKADATTFRVKR
jgi:hypothetical protein